MLQSLTVILLYADAVSQFPRVNEFPSPAITMTPLSHFRTFSHGEHHDWLENARSTRPWLKRDSHFRAAAT